MDTKAVVELPVASEGQIVQRLEPLFFRVFSQFVKKCIEFVLGAAHNAEAFLIKHHRLGAVSIKQKKGGALQHERRLPLAREWGGLITQ
jgi:hypothetical protein